MRPTRIREKKMTLQQIAYIKSTYKGLKIVKRNTNMYTNKSWASVFEIDMLHTEEITKLFKYLNSTDLLYFIGNGKLFIQ